MAIAQPAIGTETSASLATAARVARAPFAAGACVTLVFLASWVNTLDIGGTSSAENATVGLNAIVAMKLLLAGAAAVIGGVGALLSQQVQRALFSLPGVALLTLAVVLVVTSAFAYPEAAPVSRAAAGIFVAYVCFVPTAVAVAGLRRVVYAVVLGLTVHMLISWALYLFVPSLGVFQESLDGTTWNRRMGGLGHPNSVGRVAALAAVVSLALLRSRELLPQVWPARAGLWCIVGLAAATLIATWSRTSMLATIAAAVFLLADRVFSRAGLAAIMLAMAAFLGLLLAFELGGASDTLGRTFLETATKSGEVEELTSVTGRTDIWAEAIRLIRQRLLTGWGLNSAPFLLAEFSQHTHNAVLHATFSGGILAGGVVLLLLLWTLVVGLRDIEPMVRAISAFVLVSCIFEDTLLDTFPFPTTTLWLITLLYPVTRLGRAKHHVGVPA